MLPEISLDTIGFEEIVKKARSQIAEIYPQWTDYNYHDPGITILELFAFLKEAQQFYIDQTNDSMRKKFLQLIGVVPMSRHAAQTTIKLLSEQLRDPDQGSHKMEKGRLPRRSPFRVENQGEPPCWGLKRV